MKLGSDEMKVQFLATSKSGLIIKAKFLSSLKIELNIKDNSNISSYYANNYFYRADGVRLMGIIIICKVKIIVGVRISFCRV
jgi:hypothetical protein